jgi:nitrate/nitrite transport system ATP-binding protein
MNQAFLKVEGLKKIFPGVSSGDEVTVFDNIHFEMQRGEFVCIIGHSGCGKSTILNVLAGLDSATSGNVFMDGRAVSGASLDRGVVFQSHALMPWLTVEQNVAFAVTSRWPDWSKAQVAAQCLKYLDLVGLKHALNKKPHQLSGGMRQRVGIARAFAIEPKMLMMDEPFGALDALTRGVIQDELVKICAQTHQTVFMITHDVDEAILLADKILLMSNGPYAKIAEIVENPIGRPRLRAELHHNPHFYAVRNHMVDFLVSRSRKIAEGELPSGYDPRHPPVTQPMSLAAGAT